MFNKSFSKFIPAFITILFELSSRFRRDANHNSNIKKIDETQERLSNIEHMLIRLEKKIQTNRDIMMSLTKKLYLVMLANIILIVIVLLNILHLI